MGMSVTTPLNYTIVNVLVFISTSTAFKVTSERKSLGSKSPQVQTKYDVGAPWYRDHKSE